ncbi:MAG: hypothetical protein ACRD88_07380 [Terriglobia bacterium]
MKKRGKTLSEAEVFRLADALALVFWLPGAEVDKQRLREGAWAYWEKIKKEKRTVWLTYLLQLLITCPPLFERPPGFEWIQQQLMWELYYRKANQSADRDFWEAMKRVHSALRRGRPSDKARDYFWYERVQALMKQEGLSKTKAVERLAELVSEKQDTSAIWKSLARVEKEQRTRRGLLSPAQAERSPFSKIGKIK